RSGEELFLMHVHRSDDVLCGLVADAENAVSARIAVISGPTIERRIDLDAGAEAAVSAEAVTLLVAGRVRAIFRIEHLVEATKLERIGTKLANFLKGLSVKHLKNLLIVTHQ